MDIIDHPLNGSQCQALGNLSGIGGKKIKGSKHIDVVLKTQKRCPQGDIPITNMCLDKGTSRLMEQIFQKTVTSSDGPVETYGRAMTFSRLRLSVRTSKGQFELIWYQGTYNFTTLRVKTRKYVYIRIRGG